MPDRERMYSICRGCIANASYKSGQLQWPSSHDPESIRDIDIPVVDLSYNPTLPLPLPQLTCIGYPGWLQLTISFSKKPAQLIDI